MLKYIKPLILTLKQDRESQGLSQQGLAEKVGIQQSHLSKIEGGGVNLRLASFLEIAHALGLEVMLVPRQIVTTVRALARSRNNRAHGDSIKPAYELDDNDDEEEEEESDD